MFWKCNVFLILIFAVLNCFSDTSTTPPIDGVTTIQNKHLNDFRNIFLDDFVPRNFRGVPNNGAGSLGLDQTRFDAIYVNTFSSRPIANQAVFGISSAFTLSKGEYNDGITLGTTSALTTFGGPVWIQLQSDSGDFTPDNTPSLGFTCQGAPGVSIGSDSGFVGCLVNIFRNTTQIASISFGQGEAVSDNERILTMPASAFRFFDTPPAGTYTYTIKAQTPTVSGNSCGGCDFEVSGNHRIIAIGL